MAGIISLDTNVVLRFLLGDVPEQTRKSTEVIAESQVYVTDVALIEVIYVLEKIMQLSRHDITRLVKGFLGFANVIHNPYFLLETIDFWERHPALSVVDCYEAMEAKVYGNRLASFDRELVSQGGVWVYSL